MILNNLFRVVAALCFIVSCAKPTSYLIPPLRIPSELEARDARQAALRGDMAAIDTMIGWAFEHTQLDEFGISETVSFWQGTMVRVANAKGLKTYYPPDCGIYKGRIAKERIRP